MLRSRCLSALAAFVAFGAFSFASADDGGSGNSTFDVASVSGQTSAAPRIARLPVVLDPNDAETYREIIVSQGKKQWSEADRLMAGLSDRVLVGSVLAGRYLSGGYSASLGELERWLSAYGDHAEAEDIYALALQKGGSARLRELKPAQPARSGGARMVQKEEDAAWENFTLGADPGLSSAAQAKVAAYKAQFGRTARSGRFAQAEAEIARPKLPAGLLRAADIDEMRVILASSLFREGMVRDAYRLAAAAAERSGEVLPQAHWIAGLSLWRNDKQAESARHFEAAANSGSATPWLVSASAYWAARANLAARKYDAVNHWLYLAATNPRVFYGLLARRSLGQSIHYSWEARPFTRLDAMTLQETPAARRGLALLQIGDVVGAEDEFDALSDSAPISVKRSLLALAHASNMAALAVKLGDMIGESDGRLYDTALYPLPDWAPTSGWSVDRALVLAIARQESGFNPRAKSPAGAIGLMQLMPATARALGARGSLTDPAVNLEYGQKYVRRLLNDGFIDGNLLFLIASYNSGPGNVSRWLRTIGHEGDALLFLESIPARETRAFTSKVMTNYWAYCNQLGLETPSLDSIAAGDWPIYSEPRLVSASRRR